jgi:hypothetical protein
VDLVSTLGLKNKKYKKKYKIKNGGVLSHSPPPPQKKKKTQKKKL